MDNLIANYTTTTGRIGRQQWWIGSIILAVIYVIISFLILPLIGLGMPNAGAISAAGNDPNAVTNLIMGSMRAAGWGAVILTLIFAFPIYALGVKRRHDRNNAGLDFLVYIVLLIVLNLMQALGLAFNTSNIGGTVVPTPSVLYSVLGFVMLVYAIYILVVCGFLKGTTGPNQYGPDPLMVQGGRERLA